MTSTTRHTPTKTEARASFETNIKDVKHLFSFHTHLGGPGPGKKDPNLDVLTRSAFVMTTAFWETYCEDVVIEVVKCWASCLKSPDQLPDGLKLHIAKSIDKDPHDHAPWKLAGDGWQQIVRADVVNVTKPEDRRLKGPISTPVIDFFHEMLGIKDISGTWRWQKRSSADSRQRLDECIAVRNQIAHRGSLSETLRKKRAEDYTDLVERLVEVTDARVVRQRDEILGTST